MKEAVIGIDIGGTNTVFGFVDRKGNSFGENAIRTRAYGTLEDYFGALFEGVDSLLRKADDDIMIVGIGVGAPNGNYYTGRIEFAPNLPWPGVIDVAQILRMRFDVPVILTNDANAAAIGEMIFGAAVGMKNFIAITLGTGLGSGIVVDGDLVHGHAGFAGEVGHTTAVWDGRQCTCGRQGCLEEYVSIRGMRKTVLDILGGNGHESELSRMDADEITPHSIFEAAKRGDYVAKEAFEITGKLLGSRLANSVCYTNPEAIFIGGGIAQAGEMLLEPARRHLDANLLNVYKGHVKLVTSALTHKNAGILGAGALIWKELDAMREKEKEVVRR